MSIREICEIGRLIVKTEMTTVKAVFCYSG